MAKTIFIDGDPSLGVLGTIVTADFLNLVFDHVHDGVDADGHAPLLSLAGFRNRIINGGFAVNQRVHASGAALASGAYGHDRWKAGVAGCTYTFSQSNSPLTVITITAGSLAQIIEGRNIEGGTYTLSWTGTAQGKVNAGDYADSPITVTGLTAGANVTVEFGTGTLGSVQFEPGDMVPIFEVCPFFLELLRCQRYYWHTFSYGVKPGAGQLTCWTFGSPFPSGVTSYNADVCGPCYPVQMRTTPATTVWNPVAATGNDHCARNLTYEANMDTTMLSQHKWGHFNVNVSAYPVAAFQGSACGVNFEFDAEL